MTTMLLLNDFQKAGAMIPAGTLLDSSAVTDEDVAAGLAAITYDAGTMADPLAAYLAQAQAKQGVAPAYPDLLMCLIAAGAFTTGIAGNLTVTGTIDVGGNATLEADAAIGGNVTVTGTEDVGGDFSVNTNKLTVAAASGDTAIAGTADVAGDFSVATNKLTVAAASGNTAVAGTLAVTGAATLTGGATNNGPEVWGKETLASGNPTGNHVTTIYAGLSGDVTVTMPAATTAGTMSLIINQDATHTVTVAGKVLSQNETALLVADGTAWQLIASTGA